MQPRRSVRDGEGRYELFKLPSNLSLLYSFIFFLFVCRYMAKSRGDLLLAFGQMGKRFPTGGKEIGGGKEGSRPRS